MVESPVKLLTLTPEAHLYAIATLAVCALCSNELAYYLRGRVKMLERLPFLYVYVAIMALVVGCSTQVLDLPAMIMGLSWITTLLLALPAGLVAGWIAWRLELTTKRQLRKYSVRRQLRSRQNRALYGGAGSRAPGGYWPQGSLHFVRPELSSSQAALVQPNAKRGASRSITRRQLLIWLLAAGILEEVLFRGVIVYLDLRLPSITLVIAGLSASVLVFALSHLRLGYGDALTKFLLGLLALLVVLLTGTIIAAMIAHAFFNLCAWQAAPEGGEGDRVR